MSQDVPSPYTAPSAPSKTSGRQRLVSLDVFRGITIAGMILVNHPGSWANIYPPLEHAEWNGWTPTDLIFPFFLFIVGITTFLSIQSKRAAGTPDRSIRHQILKRGSIIFALGLAYAAFPYYPLSRITDVRVPGVLQRIGLTFIIAALIAMKTTTKQQIYVIIALLVGYWALVTLVPVPDSGLMGWMTLDNPSGTIVAWFDRLVLNGHLWSLSKTWDPEGILSSIPAIATVMFGVLCGKILSERSTELSKNLNTIFSLGAIGIVVGLIWNWTFPINKNLWTSSYVVFTAGAAAITLATCIWIVDVKRITWWTKPFVIFGTNAIIAYVGSAVFARLIYSVIKVPFHGTTVSLQTAIYESGFASWLSPNNASLAFALCVVLFWFVLLNILYRKQLFFKV